MQHEGNWVLNALLNGKLNGNLSEWTWSSGNTFEVYIFDAHGSTRGLEQIDAQKLKNHSIIHILN